ncbi:glycerophosphodiester phosphodiesterase family protein [Mycoplasma marinum]|nr:glycerophosphodiester phosphodiesterase family protein [Mycoplasma marinum]
MKYNLAHRGMSGIAPENTRTAFEEAKAFKFDGVELDVHLTLDNEIVIIHDEKINRTSNGRGYVKDMELSKLEEFNFANNFAGIRNEKILTLKEFLKDFKDSFKLINIELKTDVNEQIGIEELVLKEIYKYPKQNFILSSFNFDTLKRIRELDENVQIGFLWKRHKNFSKIPKKEIKAVCNFLNPSIRLFALPHLKLKYDTLKLPYNIWTIKTKRVFKKLMKNKKVNAIICDYKYDKNGIIYMKHRH